MKTMYCTLGVSMACALLCGLLLRAAPFVAVVLAFAAGFNFAVFIVCGVLDIARARGLIVLEKVRKVGA